MQLLGLWMALTGLLLPVAALGRWGWGGLALAIPTVAVLSHLLQDIDSRT